MDHHLWPSMSEPLFASILIASITGLIPIRLDYNNYLYGVIIFLLILRCYKVMGITDVSTPTIAKALLEDYKKIVNIAFDK